MKIDWSEWFMEPKDGFMYITNPSKSISLFESIPHAKGTCDIDDPSKWLKDYCKNIIRNYAVQLQLQEWNNKSIPVEDNLDYVENEAERRGL